MSDRGAFDRQPRTRAEVESESAKDALQRGTALLEAGDAAPARAWFERAARIAPEDDTVALQLALALVTIGDPAAVAVFARLAARHDVREVWLGLAGAQVRCGRPVEAAAALAASLAGHRLPEDDAFLAFGDRIAAQAEAPGWCGLLPGGTVLVRTSKANDAGGVVLRADSEALPGRRCPPGARQISVTLAGRDLLGSPIEVTRIERVEGFVAASDGGLEGWAWYPGDAGRSVVLTLAAPGGEVFRSFEALDRDISVSRALSRPRGFRLAASDLAGIEGPVRVRGQDGRELAGSPVDAGLEIRAAASAAAAIARALPALGPRPEGPVPWLATAARLAGPAAAAPRAPLRPVAVVVPVYGQHELTRACLAAVFATSPSNTAVIVVDDASPDAALAADLDALAQSDRIRLLRHRENRGFPASANAGLRCAAALPDAPDVVLLNSDTLPSPGWLELLRGAVHRTGEIGTAAPLSNDATLVTYPDPAKPGPAPVGAALHQLAALAAGVHGTACIEIPTSVGFCMYIRRECLLATGLLREDVFGQGYGEENDFCIRAGHLGWRHAAVPGAYVAHVGGQSFGAARKELLARNLDVLERLHPGYRAVIAEWLARDPLAGARRALDVARWSAHRPKKARRGSTGPVVLVTHDSGGGVEKAVRVRCAELAARGVRTIVLRPLVDRSGGPDALRRRYVEGVCMVSSGPERDFANLRFRLPDEFAALADLLRADRPSLLEVHHLLGHDHAVLRLAAELGIAYDFRVHDYAAICARINLVGATGRYCGEPELAVCTACVADAGREIEEAIEPAALRRRSATDLAGARAVIVPSRDTAARLRRHFPAIELTVRPHEDDADLPPVARLPSLPRRVAVIGAIGTAKGYDVLLACARDAVERNLPLAFTVIGHTEDDQRLLATGRVFVTGPYEERDVIGLIRAQGAHLAWLPSVWPETWCYALGEAMRAGLPVMAFDIGAQAERIRDTGRGSLLPLGLSAAAINNAMLALRTVASDECAPSGDSFLNSLRSITARP